MADTASMQGCAIVTGASRGLGAQVAVALAAHGLDVIAHGRDEQALAGTAAEVASAGRRSVVVAGELTEPATRDRLLEAARELGGVSVLVGCASEQVRGGVAELTDDAWDRAWHVDVRAHAGLLAGAAAAGASAAVLISSVEGLAPFPGQAAYSAAKAAIHSLVASAAVELAPMRVNAVAPGLIWREGLDEAWPDGVERWNRAAPLHRSVTIDEVTAAIVFLASPSASGITGVTLPVDAGWSSSARW